jgi:hypothetical protein
MGAIWNFIFGGTGSDVVKLGEIIAAIWDDVTDAAMWESVGWLLLGAVLMAIGLMLWLRIPQAAAGAAADAAVLA